MNNGSRLNDILKSSMLTLAMSLLFALTVMGQAPASVQKAPESLSAAEFSKLINEMSEEGGYFRSDNFTSNETSYLHIVDKMRQLGASGGVIHRCRPRTEFPPTSQNTPEDSLHYGYSSSGGHPAFDV
ncbi:MAG: hypothetical protein IPL01_04490 [Acidobacteria bacterium]|nr:hypothetical protein [Acidobacteriota bacterium]